MFDISLVRHLPKDTKIPFLKVRLVAMVLSVLAIIASIFLFTTKNLNYGLDFKGGTVWEFHLDESPTDADLGAIRDLGPGLGLGELAIQTIGQSDKDKVQAIRLSVSKQPALEGDENDDKAQQVALTAIQAAVVEMYPEVAKTENTLSVQVLGTKVSGELKKKGIEAVLAALIMVLIYIWFRFEWQFGLGAVVALTHDVILTIGVFSFTALEFNLSIVAAILTIVGYSLNDTVVVYDRIRENLRKFKKKPLEQVLNMSINDTLSRTILTSLTTMLALLALYIWGGPGLNGFAFAMIWGVFVGTYSSIFVAAPILLMLGVNRKGPQK